jgi:hypothetical protein
LDAGRGGASFNVENLFSRPRAFNTADWATGEPVLAAYREFNTLIAKPIYSPADRDRMRELLLALDVYQINNHGAVRRHLAVNPRWAWLRKNRGGFDREPADATNSVQIIAGGRGDWIGWVELATEAVNESSRTTARVIGDIDADILAVIEVEDRAALVRFEQGPARWPVRACDGGRRQRRTRHRRRHPDQGRLPDPVDPTSTRSTTRV